MRLLNSNSVVECRTSAVPVAVVGAGYIAEYHLAVLRQLGGTEVVGACDPNQERCRALCDQWNIPYGARSLDELLRDRKPAVVHILVPPPYHFEVAQKALNAGVHVFLEKPMALHTAECDQLISSAQANNLRLGVNHNALYHPLFRRLHHDLAHWKLGKVEHVVSTNNLPLAQLSAGDHDHWMFRNPENVLFEQGPHPLSQICDLLGHVESANTVCSGEQRLRGGNVFYSAWQVSMTCARGTAQLFMSFGRTFPASSLLVIGQDGTAQLDFLNNVYVLDRRTKYLDPVDIFFRSVKQAWQVACCGLGGILRYSGSTLRLTGRSDPYYASMRASIEAFYRSLCTPTHQEGSAENGRLVIDGLEQAVSSRGQAGTRYIRNGAAPAPVCASGPTSAALQPSDKSARGAGDIAVLGGSGFIGRHLVRALLDAGHAVRLLVRRPAVIADLMGAGQLETCVGDVRNADDVNRAVEGCGAVIHLVSGAPPSWSEFERLFVGGTRNAAEACIRFKVPRFLFASSITAYYLGNRRATITEATPLDAYPERRCDYSRAKIACERLLMEMHRENALPVTIFRPGIVVGANSPPEHLGVGFWPSSTHCVTWSRAVSRGLPFVLVDDVVAALISALEQAGLEGKSFNLVGDVRLSAAEYVAALRGAYQRDIRLHRQSVLKWTTLEIMKWAVKALAGKPNNTRLSYHEFAYRSLASTFDCTLAKQELGWKPVSDREHFIELAIRRAANGRRKPPGPLVH